MSALSIRLPDSLHNMARKLAAQDGVSVNQFITLALAEKISALQTEVLLTERAARSSKERYLKALDALPDFPTAPGDEL